MCGTADLLGPSVAMRRGPSFARFFKYQNASLAQRNPVPLGRLSIGPQSRSVVRRLTAGFNQEPPRIALIAPRQGPGGSLNGADR